MTFMKASVTSSRARMPFDEAIAVSTAPAVQMPNASRSCSAQAPKASPSASPARAGSSAAVPGSNPWWPRTGAGSGKPGYSPAAPAARAAARALASARAATSRRPASVRSFVSAEPVWPSWTRKIETPVSFTCVAWVGIERAKRDTSERSRVTVACASPVVWARARSATSSASSGTAAVMRRRPGPRGSARARRRGRRTSPARARPCRSSSGPTGASPPGRRRHRGSPRSAG